MTDPYRRNAKDISLADGYEELRTDRLECETDRVPWEAEAHCSCGAVLTSDAEPISGACGVCLLSERPDHVDEYTVYDSSERQEPVCQHCGLAIMNSALVVGRMQFCDEFCKERYAAKMGQD